MKTLSERQQGIFNEIKEKKRAGKAFSDWEKKFLAENNLAQEIELVQTSQAASQTSSAATALFKNCQTCLGTERFSFKRIADDIQNIRGDLVNIKGTIWSFGCPECRPANFRTIELVLLENPKWEFLNTETDRKRLEKFFFFNKENSLSH